MILMWWKFKSKLRCVMTAAITDENLKKLIAKNLVAARSLSGMTQSQAMNVLYPQKGKIKNRYNNTNRISEYENGYREISVIQLLKLCKAYGVSADYILGFSAEAELNEDSRTVGQLYNATNEMVQESVEKMTLVLTQKCSEFIAKQPSQNACLVIDAAKQLIKAVREKNGINDALNGLNHSLIEFEKKQAVQLRNFEMAISNIIEHENLDGEIKHIMQCDKKIKNKIEQQGKIKFIDWHCDATQDKQLSLIG